MYLYANISLGGIMEDLIGKVGICSHGRIGVITDFQVLPWGDSWVGVGIDGKEWSSRNPIIIANSVEEYIKKYRAA